MHVLEFGERYPSGERELPDDIRAEEEMFLAIEVILSLRPRG